MSEIALAQLLDQLNAEGLAFVVESERDISVSSMSFDNARAVLTQCEALGWAASAYDSENSEWSLETISPDFAPFRVATRKPVVGANTLKLLTKTGFAYWLKQGHEYFRWHVMGLPEPIRTLGRIYEPWESNAVFEPAPLTKNPRSLVREHTAQRVVCADIRPWLLVDDDIRLFGNPCFQIWAEAAIAATLRALADEIDSEDQSLKFKGPPRLSVALATPGASLAEELGKDALANLQLVARWVFENEREAEMRHVLFATELARSGGNDKDAISCAKSHLVAALEGAKIAYQPITLVLLVSPGQN